MALPIVETPRYECTLASQDTQVQYRPFLVKEEKILLVAMESKDNNEIINATKQVIKACTYDKLDVDKLPMFDIEYLLLQIRSKSVGEISKFNWGILIKTFLISSISFFLFNLITKKIDVLFWTVKFLKSWIVILYSSKVFNTFWSIFSDS